MEHSYDDSDDTAESYISELLSEDDSSGLSDIDVLTLVKPVPDDEQLDDPFHLVYAKNYNHIFKFLAVKDILNLSETCKTFYKLTGEICENPMKRIKLVVNETKGRRIKEAVELSTRQYKHLEINKMCGSSPEITMLIHKCALSLVTIRTNYELVFEPETKLPALRELFYYGHNYGASQITFSVNGLISSACNLKSLTIWSGVANAMTLAKIIDHCFTLTKFVLQGSSTEIVLTSLQKQIPLNCRLRTFHLSMEKGLYPEGLLIDIFVDQCESIRDVKFCGSIPLLMQVLETFVRLERLTFSQVGDFNLDFSESSAYEPLRSELLQEANFMFIDDVFLEAFLEANENLDVLYVSYLSIETLRTVWSSTQNLSLLKFACLDPMTTFEELNEEIEDCRDAFGPRMMKIERI